MHGHPMLPGYFVASRGDVGEDDLLPNEDIEPLELFVPHVCMLSA